MSDLTVELFVPCERVSLDDQGRPVLERTLSRLVLPAFPAKLDIALYAEVWGTPFVTARVQAKIVGPDGNVVVEQVPEGVALDEEGVALFAIPLESVALSRPGVYTAMLLEDGRELARRRFRADVEISTQTSTA